MRLIAIDGVDYLRSDSKYTIVAWRSRLGGLGVSPFILSTRGLWNLRRGQAR